MTPLTIPQLLDAHEDIAAMAAEHHRHDAVAQLLGIPEDQWWRLRAAAAKAADDGLLLQDKIEWPPESRTDRQCGLAFAWSLGALTMLQAMRGRDDAA